MQLTWGFVQAGLDVQTSAVCIAVLWFGLDGILLCIWLLTCTFISLLGFSSGLDKQQCPACTKPCSLCAIISNHPNMQKVYRQIFFFISALTIISRSDDPKTNHTVEKSIVAEKTIPKEPTPVDYSKFSYQLLNSDYVFQIEISGIDTKIKKDAFTHQDDQYSPKQKVDGYILKVKYKMTNPYDKVIMAPVPHYYYIGTLDNSFFSASTTRHRDCSCAIDNSADLTDIKGKDIYSLSDGRCGYDDPCVKFEPNETKEFIVTFTDPIYKDAKQLIFSGFHRQGQSSNSTRKRDIVLLLDIDNKKVINEIQL